MANQIKKKFIGNNQVDETKILINNNEGIRARNAADTLDFELIRLTSDDYVQISGLKDPVGDRDAAHKDYVDQAVSGGGQALQDHINDAEGAHAASAISVAPGISGLTATNVQAAIAEIQGDLNGIDATYVNVAGDTMTGDLLMGSNKVAYDDSMGAASINFPSAGSMSVDAPQLTVTYSGTADFVSPINTISMTSTGLLSPAGFKPNNTSGGALFFTGISQVDSQLSGGVVTIQAFSDINLEANGGVGTIFGKGTLDMEAHSIIDLSQVQGLNAATISGNALRYDELGVYSPGAGYGIATLDSAGKIPASQLPSAIMEYKGTWDASTNTPMLANGSGSNAPEDAGHLYIVSVGGTVDFGAGNISFNAGDSVILSASLVWEKSTTANLVTSVNGAQGVVVLDSEDLTYHQGNTSDWTVADDSSIKLTLDEVGSRLTAGETADLTYLLLDGSRSMTGALDMNSHQINNVTDPSSAQDASTKAYTDAKVSDTAYGSGWNGISSIAPSKNAVYDQMELERARILALESVSPEIYKKTLVAGDITAEYIDLPHQAIQTNDFHVFADRLALHQGAAEDFTLSVVSGVTRITFLNDMVGSGNQKLQAGDTIYVRYKRSV